MSDAAADLWRFALAIYGRPGVAPACLVLQDEAGRDVNVALFCAWLGLSGRGALSREALNAADGAVFDWRVAVVEKLRAARRAIKAPGREALYGKAKALELEAEKEVQRRLAALAPPPRDEAPAARLDAALANLALYVGTGPAVEPLRVALRAMAAEGF